MKNKHLLLGHHTRFILISNRSLPSAAAGQDATAAIIVEAFQRVALTVLMILVTSASGFANSGQSITFDAPGAGTVANFGTFAVAINDLGETIGYSVDNQNLYHGFLRYPSGAIKNFDAAGGGTTPGSGQGTLPLSVNNEGTIAGNYQDANNVIHAFVRQPDGRITTFEVPGAGSGPLQGTQASDINSEGITVGVYIDSRNVAHGFFRSTTGTLTSFDAPSAGTGPGQGTSPSPSTALSPLGVLTGQYVDGQGIYHGFVRQRTGAISSFDPSGSTTTFSEGINPQGTVVGTFGDSKGVFHGFVRTANGEITSFDVPGALYNTVARDITLFGVITGFWNDSNNVYHGFIRYPNDAILKFDVPGGGSVPQSGQGTIPLAINFWGEIAGQIQDSNNVYHGFIRLP